MDVETRRLKNRIRQQRYRARKRLEKTLRSTQNCEGDQNGHKEGSPLPHLLPALNILKTTNECSILRHDQGSLIDEAKNQASNKDGTANGCAVLSQDSNEKALVFANAFFSENMHMSSFQDPGRNNTTITAQSFQIIQPLATVGESFNLNLTRKYNDKGINDLARRQKNRERQRRYRARKRFEADMKIAHLKSGCTLVENAPQPYAPSIKLVNRVYCSRDWKREARMAFSQIEPDSSSYETAQEEVLETKVHLEQVTDSDVNERATTLIHGRRDWKADARNKVM